MKNIAIIYRDNDLFAKWIGFVKALLEKLGYFVETTIFPKGTDEYNAIRPWIEEHRDMFKGKLVLCDHTVGFSSETNGVEGVIGLDEIFEQATFRAIFGKEFSRIAEERDVWKGKYDLSEGRYDVPFAEAVIPTEKSLSILLSLVSKASRPKKIFILDQCILSHGPWQNLKKTTDGPDEPDKRKLACEMLRDMFSKSVTTPEIISGDYYPHKKKIDQSGSWVIVDRHSYSSFRNAVKLQLPIGNFFEDLQVAGLVSVAPGKMKKSLEVVFTQALDEKKGGD